MLDQLKKNNIVVFFAVRQDLLRWGLSKYHGDGTGKTGHLQFDLANGKINKQDIANITVDCQRLGKIITECEKVHAKKRRLMAQFKSAGIETFPLLYEEFLTDPASYLRQLFARIELDVTQQEITSVLNQQAYFKKVHADDISTFVCNHQEVINTIGGRFLSWKDA